MLIEQYLSALTTALGSLHDLAHALIKQNTKEYLYKCSDSYWDSPLSLTPDTLLPINQELYPLVRTLSPGGDTITTSFGTNLRDDLRQH